MAKPVTIKENKVLQSFGAVKKIRTNLVGEGSQNWIPEEEAADYAKIKKISISKNDVYIAADDDKDAYNEVKVKVASEKAKLKGLRVTKNGTYTAESQGCDAFNNVSVNVPGGGQGGGGDYTIKWEKILDVGYGGYATEIDGVLYTLGYNGQLYSFNGTNWTQLESLPSAISGRGSICAYQGKLLGISGYTSYYFDGSHWVQWFTNPIGFYGAGGIEYNGKLHVCGGDGFQTGSYDYHYVYDGSAWTIEASMPVTGNNHPFTYESGLYVIPHYNTGKIFKYTGSAWTEFLVLDSNNTTQGYGDVDLFGSKRKMMYVYADGVYTFNGQFIRPEEISGVSGYPEFGALNGIAYLWTGGGTWRGDIVTSSGARS